MTRLTNACKKTLFRNRWLGPLGIFIALFFSAGCEDANAKRIQGIQSKQVGERSDAIREAFRYLPQLVRMDRNAALHEIQYQLNAWSQSIVTPPDWKSASLLESISGTLRTIDFSSRMTKLEFGEPECEFLLQSQLFKEVGGWVIDLPYRDLVFKSWLEQQRSVLSAEDWLRLETTMKLFDWTVRNVALEGQAKDIERLTTNAEMPLNDTAAIYRQLPWQTMMFGRGENWQRARVFTQLAFVQGIDCLVLALPSESGAVENASLRLWCIGVPIGSEIYLFEPQWGLPLPSQSTEGIATLREAKENPQVMRRAKLPGRFEYPVEQKDLSNLIALLDLEPFTVGRTMYSLERSLTGDSRIRISLDADQLEQRVNQIDSKLSVRLWNVPWLAHVYNQSLRQRLNEKSPFSISYVDRFGAYITDTPISKARKLHFKGKFSSDIEQTGALRTYMDVRIDEKSLKKLEDDRETQQRLSVVKSPNETVENYQFRVKQAQEFYRRSKYEVAMFLGMANIDLDNADTAVDWLSKRLLEQPNTERLHSHAHYLLGRAYEQQNQIDKAIEEYKFEDSVQAAGNRIRIRKLETKSGNAEK